MYNFFIIFVILFSSQTFSMKVIDHKNPKNNVFGNKWELITDEVMGGKSEAEFRIIDNNLTGIILFFNSSTSCSD